LNGLQGRINNTGRRIEAFLVANDGLLGNVNKSGIRTDLGAIVVALGDSGGEQAAGRVTRSERPPRNAHCETAEGRDCRRAKN
jgi:hypothetical protein